MNAILSSSLTAIGNTLKAGRLYLPGLITVLISYFVFIQLPQGQDVILRISEYFWPGFWTTVICVPMWCIFCWYSARLVAYERCLQGTIPIAYHTHVPRLIAFNTLTSIQVAIIALPTIGHLSQGGIWLFILAQNAFYFFFHKTLTTQPFSIRYATFCCLIALIYLVFIVYLAWPSRHSDPHTISLPAAAYALFIFQVGVMTWFIRRRKHIGADVQCVAPIDHLRIGKWKTVRVPAAIRVSEQWLFNRMIIIFAAGLILYFVLPTSSGFATAIGPLGIVTLSFGALVLISNVIIIVSNHIGINLFVILFVWAIAFGKIYNPYNIRTSPVSETQSIVQRPEMITYVQDWLKKRKDMIAASKSFPVYVVIADGGASRSGYWVHSALSAIQERTEYMDPGNAFSEHLLVLAGASGGSVGNATFYALLKKNMTQDSVAFMRDGREFLRKDFLSPVLTHWFCSDFWQHFIPLSISDRAVALEDVMELHGKEPLANLFDTSFSDVVDRSGCLPMLFINTTNVQQGVPAVVSSVDISSISERIDVLDLVDADSANIDFSTGVVLGARFPYVSPAGNIGNKSFVDGGYFDNTGAGILHEMMQVLTRKIDRDSIFITGDKEKDHELAHKLRFQMIYLRNSSLSSSDPGVMHPLVNDAAAPIITVLGTYGSQTDVNNSRLKKFLYSRNPDTPFVDMNLFRRRDELDIPMNWVISDYSLRRMNQNLFDAMKVDYPNIITIPKVPDSVKCNCRKKQHLSLGK